MAVQLIKELRKQTGAGFLDCKKALMATGDNIEEALAWLHNKGVTRAIKKAGVIAAEGRVQTASNASHVVIFELNTQTDFGATSGAFQTLATTIADALLQNEFTTIKAAQALEVNGQTIAELIVDTTVKIGEKIDLRRGQKIARASRVIGAYTHVNKRVAALVVAEGGDEEAVRNVAMHVAAMNPPFLDASTMPQDQLQKMQEAIATSPILENKPAAIRANIARGMLRKHLAALTLVGQEFVMAKMSVGDYLASRGAKAIKFIRYEIGEGVEKATPDFVQDVNTQMPQG